jgi:hypothetical protein
MTVGSQAFTVTTDYTDCTDIAWRIMHALRLAWPSAIIREIRVIRGCHLTMRFHSSTALLKLRSKPTRSSLIARYPNSGNNPLCYFLMKHFLSPY